MTTTTPRRQTAHPASPADRRRKVEGLLRELAYVLHATRRINQQLAWPADTGRTCPTPPEIPGASA
jgi:hypothetical protein